MAVQKVILLVVNVEGEVEVEKTIDTDTDGLNEISEVMSQVAQ